MAKRCVHNKELRFCSTCQGGGSGLCDCGKNKYTCSNCGGTSLCVHKIRKRDCVECIGAGVCIHNKRRQFCIECGGSQICLHNKRKQYCKECHGSAFCEHSKEKRFCVECGGTGICEHGKIKRTCHDCKGNGICIHNKQTRYCYDCKGSSICTHNKRKELCKDCGGSALCKSSWCLTTGMKKYNGYCLSCCVQTCPDIQVSRNYKTKEKTVVNIVIEAFPQFTWIADRKVADGCSQRRPDLLLDMGSHIIIVEVDENKHNDYDCSCENKRLMELSQDLHHRPIVFIRFNPDGYINEHGVTIRSCWRLNHVGVLVLYKECEWLERTNALKQQIQYWIDNPSDKMVEIIQLFY
jgi:hypothetical protein